LKFLQIKNQTDTSADLYFYGDIVNDAWDKWTDADTCPQDIIDALDVLKDTAKLNIYINSGGGNVFAGLAIYNILKRHKAYKTVYVDGLAASIASVIMFAGDKIIIPSNSFTMIHKAWTFVVGNANDLRKMADDLDRIEEGIVNVYADNLADGVKIETIKQMMNDETWLNGYEASKYFKVEVAESNQAAAKVIKGDSMNNYTNIPDTLHIVDSLEPEAIEPDVNDLHESELELMAMQLQLA